MWVAIARIFLTRPHAAVTPKPGQDRKVAAILDAQSRRGFRVTLIQKADKSQRFCLRRKNSGIEAPASLISDCS